MASPARINYKIYQGSTWSEVLHWESDTKVYKPITAITKSAPVVVTAVAHGAPVGWRVKFTNILGMTELNSDTAYHFVTDKTTDNLTVNSINSLAYTTYVSGGIVEYNLPVDLDGYTARMQIRPEVDSSEVIYELTTENGDIVIDNVLKTITLTIPAESTATFTFETAVYSLEMINGGQVTPLIGGGVILVKEVTR